MHTRNYFSYSALSYQRYQLSLLHDGLEMLAPLRARSHLSTEQIPRWQVSVAVLCHYLLTLGALSRARPTFKRRLNKKKNSHVAWRQIKAKCATAKVLRAAQGTYPQQKWSWHLWACLKWAGTDKVIHAWIGRFFLTAKVQITRKKFL